MYKIEAVVKTLHGENVVLNEMPDIKYEKYGKYLLGVDQYGVFLNCFEKVYYNSCKAFGGRVFKIPMVNGDYIEANGQYWRSGDNVLKETIGSELCYIGIATPKLLKDCYVFLSTKADKDEYLKLRSTYSNKIFGYDEYREHLKPKKKG